MEMQAEEKWRISRREGRSSSCSRSGGGGAAAAAPVVRVAGERRSKKAAPRSFSSRCAGLVKEQRARFYIMRRCVTMLICWRDYP